MTSSAKWSIVGVVVILAVLVAIVPQMLAGQGQSESQGVEDGFGEASTSIIAQRPDCVAQGAAGVELPCMGGANGSGNDQATVVNLWAWWCEPCRAELPVFDQFAQAHPELNVIGVHADQNEANGAALLDDLGVNLASYQDDSNLFAGTLGLPSVVPITVIVNPQGAVVGTYPTPFESVEQLEQAVSEVL
ncbi:thiol-disulfide isomerase [Corynebacterium deserti GIMN1.010]|uniref:Thiol-disulfide isomerase n=1 Tax=Corynebacterium deserti GIMN1.010 TaxID=931089 RepID=A0A0M4CMV7_9CORY|nr:TlpA disulfide reductase family protein [Corynebacterium deserti]ALC04780.1 thiol-disulfide isomerase [Corynebacterium deserti GIMN1.010]